MSKTANIIKDFLLKWIILHGDNWVFHVDAFQDDYIEFDIALRKIYLEEEDQFPTDKYRWGSYFRITKKGREYATMR
jgi:hypothetical protein